MLIPQNIVKTFAIFCWQLYCETKSDAAKDCVWSPIFRITVVRCEAFQISGDKSADMRWSEFQHFRFQVTIGWSQPRSQPETIHYPARTPASSEIDIRSPRNLHHLQDNQSWCTDTGLDTLTTDHWWTPHTLLCVCGRWCFWFWCFLKSNEKPSQITMLLNVQCDHDTCQCPACPGWVTSDTAAPPTLPGSRLLSSTSGQNCNIPDSFLQHKCSLPGAGQFWERP